MTDADRRRGERGGAPACPGALRAAGILAATVLVGACTPDSELVEYRVLAESEGARAEVTVPVNEARSVGTYRLRVDLPGGVSGVVQGAREGMIGNVWVADLNRQGLPEVVVGMTSAGSGSYGTVHVYLHDGTGFVLHEMAALDAEMAAGYMGHDEFEVVGGKIIRRFPVYVEGDVNADPTGGTRVLQYSFPAGQWLAHDGADVSEASGADDPHQSGE